MEASSTVKSFEKSLVATADTITAVLRYLYGDKKESVEGEMPDLTSLRHPRMLGQVINNFFKEVGGLVGVLKLLVAVIVKKQASGERFWGQNPDHHSNIWRLGYEP